MLRGPMTKNNEAIRILIADDHPVFRQGIYRAFSDNHDLDVVEEAVNGPELLEKIEKTKVDVVLLDISMDGEWSLDYMKELKNKYPKLPVVILSVYPEEHFAMRYIKAGASGVAATAARNAAEIVVGKQLVGIATDVPKRQDPGRYADRAEYDDEPVVAADPASRQQVGAEPDHGHDHAGQADRGHLYAARHGRQ